MNALFSHLFLLNPCIYIHVSSYGSDNTVLNKNNVPLAALFSLPFPNSQQLTSWQEIPGHDTTSAVPGMDLAELAEQREALDKTLFCNSSFGGLPLQAVFLEKKIPWESTFWNKLRTELSFIPESNIWPELADFQWSTAASEGPGKATIWKEDYWPEFKYVYAHHVRVPTTTGNFYRIHKSYLKTTDLKHILQ